MPKAPELVDGRAGFPIWFYSRLAACPCAVFGFYQQLLAKPFHFERRSDN